MEDVELGQIHKIILIEVMNQVLIDTRYASMNTKARLTDIGVASMII